MDSNADTTESCVMERVGSPNLSAVPADDSDTVLESQTTFSCFNDTEIDSTVIEKTTCETNNEHKIEQLDIEGDGSSKTGDGSDSGVEVFGNNVLQRAQSSNSGGYASSCGLEEVLGAQSCASSLISCCSDTYDMAASKTSSTLLEDLKLTRRGEGTSEGGSESSSVTGSSSTRTKTVVAKRPNPSVNKKKVAMIEPGRSKSKGSESDTPSTARSRSRTNPSKQVSKAPSLATQDRARSRDKSGTATPILKSTSQKGVVPRTRTKTAPDSLPNNIDLDKTVRAASTTRVRTPGTTPTGDGRWPSVGAKQTPRSTRGGSVTLENASMKTRVAALALETKSSALDKYATLPRRKREKSQESETTSAKERSNSITREPTLAKTVAMLKKQHSRESTPSKSLPPYPRKKTNNSKTPIYLEKNVQTALTGTDVDCAIAGITKVMLSMVPVEKKTRDIQVDIRDKEMERLEAQLKHLSEDQAKLQAAFQTQNEKLNQTEQKLCEEREEKLTVQKELQRNTERVLAILRSIKSDGQDQTDGDSLMLLESQLKVSGEIVVKQQEEISKLNSICRTLQEEKERTLVSQRRLEKKQHLATIESDELLTFLQEENSSLAESLREAETKIQSHKEALTLKQAELERKKDEFRCLVRYSEQKSQEKMALQARLASLETRSRELLLQQGASVSGAAVALSGLGARLDGLVDQLVDSYKISEQDLEDVVYHNEVYHNSSSSTEGSPKRSAPPSPQRGRSFVSVVIAAIRNAATGVRTQTITKSVQKKRNDGNESDSTDMLDSETEPCLMMENVLEDVTMPDSHSHNMVSSVNSNMSQKLDITSEKIDNAVNTSEPSELQDLSHLNINRLSQIDGELNGEDTGGHDSLHSLSQAILNRQQSEAEYSAAEEMSVNDSTYDMPSLSECCPTLTLVDQVIEVDNLVTKLLKVLRIIQLENESCLEELNNERNILRNTIQNSTNFHVKSELQDASLQLSRKVAELTETRAELDKHRAEIEKLNTEVRQVNSRCSQAEALINRREDETRRALQQWRETGTLPDEEALSKIVSTTGEIPILMEKLNEKDRQLSEITQTLSVTRNLMTDSWSKAVTEAKRQYDAIDRALERLHTVQSVVRNCPELSQLQRDLEETNFQSASNLEQSLTISKDGAGTDTNTSDYNANGSPIKVGSPNQATIINGRA